MTHLQLACLAAFAWLALANGLQAQTWSADAATLYERSATENVQFDPNKCTIVLARGELIEDDGPAAGYCYQPNVENLSEEVWIRKELHLDDPTADGATLLVAPGGELRAMVNGREVELDGPRKVGQYWQAYAFDPKVLRSGTNEFILRGSGKVWIARDEDFAAGSLDRTSHPNRSAKSRDGGKTWDDARLGAGDNLDGEYYLRLFLDRFLPMGRITTSVIDLGNLDQRPIGAAIESVGEVAITLGAEQLPDERIEVRVRRGSTFVPEDATWTPWRELEMAKPAFALQKGVLSRSDNRKNAGRYLQLELRLHAGGEGTSPQITSLAVAAEPKVASTWTDRLRLTDAKNSPVVRSSISFPYESFDLPSLKELRSKYDLDSVVRGAESELELISRLAIWSANRWPKLGHLGEAYPPWDALAILAPHTDGTPVGGFCLQYNLVFLQACESFGVPGRIISIGPGNHTQKIRGGHETVELWSNQFEKWIYVDGNTAWYAVDEATDVPLSLWELRERQLAAWSGKTPPPMRIVKLAETRYDWPGLDQWPPFVELRLVPRSNFLAQQFPLPLHQGMRGWFWTGHYVWSDHWQPAREIYSQRVYRRGDWEWSLNHAHITLEPTATPGELRVHLDNHTPGLDTHLASFEDKPPQPVEPVFVWKLRPGPNRLTVRPRNIAGKEGIATWVAVEYAE